MAWNWQQPDWPEFTWSPDRLAKAEDHFLINAGAFQGAVSHLDREDRDRLTVEMMSQEAITTSEIEGEVLDRESVQSSIRGALGLSATHGRASHAERGIAEMTVMLYRNFHQPLDEQTLCKWHTLLLNGRHDVRVIGRYRTHPEPMQVVSGRMYEPTVHFEAPPSATVPTEMAAFLEWFNRTAPSETEPLPAVTRAGIAHLYFESIHPFEDGNGRIGRAISEKVLAQSVGQPALTALAATILLHRRAYYEQLENANTANQVTDWLAWFAGITLEAQHRTQAHIEFLIDKTKFLDRHRATLGARQLKVLLRMLHEGPSGFKGGLSAGNYISISKTSPATARRDLNDLVEKGVLGRTGNRRHVRYHLTIPLRPVGRIRIDADGDVVVE